MYFKCRPKNNSKSFFGKSENLPRLFPYNGRFILK